MSSYIEVKNVSKSFGGKAILQDVSLSIEQGTTVGKMYPIDWTV